MILTHTHPHTPATAHSPFAPFRQQLLHRSSSSTPPVRPCLWSRAASLTALQAHSSSSLDLFLFAPAAFGIAHAHHYFSK